MSALTDAGRARLLGAWTGQMPAPDLYLQPAGDAAKVVGRQRLWLLGLGGELKASVKLGPAPVPWALGGLDLVDETGVVQGRIALGEVVSVQAGQQFEYTLTLRAP